MGVKARQRPERLAEKLLQIRIALRLSQSGGYPINLSKFS
jgi:hypothetical protein